MKSLKKLLFLSVLGLSFLFIACGSKVSEKDLTAYLNGAMQLNAGFDYDYGDVSKTGSKADYDIIRSKERTDADIQLSTLGFNFSKEQSEQFYQTILKNAQKVKYEIKCDEIKDKTATFTITSDAIDKDALSKNVQDKCKQYSNDKNNVGKSKETICEDCLNIMVDCYNNATTKEVTKKVVIEKQDNKWTVKNPTELASSFIN